LDLPDKVGVGFIDQILQEERTNNRCETIGYDVRLNVLPQGVYVALQKAPSKAFLFRYGALWQWTPEGYLKGPKITPSTKVNVLTPASTVNALRAGFQPLVSLNKVRT
jgi:hypothetical protein